MATRMQQRRGTASQWVAANTVLTAGELGYETDTGQFKIGDGTTVWLSLPYFKDTLDLDITSKAPLESPTFTGTVVLPSTTSIGDVSSSELAVLNGITASTSELNILDGVTANASELNKLTGLLASTAELNKLVGVTASTTELNYTDGVTSGIQTQLDAKAPTANPTFTGTVAGVTKTHVGLGNVDNTSDANKPVSSATQTALDLKANIASPTFTGTVTLAQAPTVDLHAATKAYVDNVVSGINFHQPVRVATTANITLSGTQTIDGVAVVAGDRVLVKDQTDQKTNGIYVVAAGTWSRATDADNTPSGELAGGDFSLVLEGTTNSGYGYVCSNTSAITIGTTNITYVAYNAAKAVVAGNGLQESTPGTLSIDTAVTISSANYSSKGAIVVGTGTGTFTTQAVGTNGQVLTANSALADGVEWTTVSALPSQTGNSGKYLTTNGTSASWATVNATPALDDITDVTLTSSTANDVVYYNGTGWVNKYVASIPTLTNAQSGTTYTLVLGDAGKIVEVGNASAITLTVPTNAGVAYPVGTQITILQTGAGQITVTGPAGGTLNATPGTKLRAQWSSATLLKRATDTWVLIGDLTA
jgi:hypothetical protein